MSAGLRHSLWAIFHVSLSGDIVFDRGLLETYLSSQRDDSLRDLQNSLQQSCTKTIRDCLSNVGCTIKAFDSMNDNKQSHPVLSKFTSSDSLEREVQRILVEEIQFCVVQVVKEETWDDKHVDRIEILLHVGDMILDARNYVFPFGMYPPEVLTAYKQIKSIQLLLEWKEKLKQSLGITVHRGTTFYSSNNTYDSHEVATACFIATRCGLVTDGEVHQYAMYLRPKPDESEEAMLPLKKFPGDIGKYNVLLSFKRTGEIPPGAARHLYGNYEESLVKRILLENVMMPAVLGA